MPSVSEVLELTLQEMEEVGWIQGDYKTEHGDCLVSLIWRVIGRELTWINGGRELMVATVSTLKAQAGCKNLAMWNDEPERTFSQVREVIRRAIAEQELAEVREATC